MCLGTGFWHWGWEAVHQPNYMSSCLCSSHAPTLQWNRRGCLGITWRSFSVPFKCQLSPWRLVKHKMTVSPGHTLLSSNMRPPDVLCLQLTGCSLSRRCGSSFGVGFVLVLKKGRSQHTDLTWTWGITLKHKDPPIYHSSLSSWGGFILFLQFSLKLL